jgi:hypothetical protein
MIVLSFKSFATAKKFAPPVSAVAVANSLNMHAPPAISMRAMIATAAPFVPYKPSYADASNAGQFLWYDEAALPPWFQPPAPDPLRAATSFEFVLWFQASPTSKTLVDDTILSQSVASGGGLGYSPGVLDGNYTFQITAINAFGSASTPVMPAQFAPPAAAPNITAVLVNSATSEFQVTGTGFEQWNGKTVLINAEAGVTFAHAVQQSVIVDSSGGFSQTIKAAGVCQHASPLRFSVSLPSSAGHISNLVTTNCP